MSIPKNPNTLVIQNSFYPKGLREIDIYDYYQKVKPLILKEVIGKNLTFYFATSLNNIVVMRRANTPTGYLRLNYLDYDETITGRTISIHSNFNRTSDFGIVDIDIDDFNLAKRTTLNVYKYIVKNCSFVDSVKIKYTGKDSFHLICNLKRTMYIDNFRLIMRKSLEESKIVEENFLYEIDKDPEKPKSIVVEREEVTEKSEISKLYTISSRRIKGVPNLDLSSNKYLGGYITLNSLSVIGLRSIMVPYNELSSFKKENAKI
jgi:hypothetical protein